MFTESKCYASFLELQGLAGGLYDGIGAGATAESKRDEFSSPLGYTEAGLRCPSGRLSNYCYRRKMSKEDCIEMTGTVVEKFPSGLFSVQIDQERIVLAHLAGKLRRNRIRVLAGDRVTIEMSPYDLTKGRITYRHK